MKPRPWHVRAMPDARSIHVTFFADELARTKTSDELMLWELRDLVRTTTASEKGKLPWLKLARFGDQPSKNKCLRHDDNVRAISGVELDYDGEKMSFDEALARLRKARLAALVYTSPSHTPAKPRWRVALPASDSWSPMQRARLVARVNGVIRRHFL